VFEWENKKIWLKVRQGRQFILSYKKRTATT
jgi:hypothetical protein